MSINWSIDEWEDREIDIKNEEEHITIKAEPIAVDIKTNGDKVNAIKEEPIDRDWCM